MRSFQVMALRLLVQILIKVHAGSRWGADEAGVAALTNEASKLADDISDGRNAP